MTTSDLQREYETVHDDAARLSSGLRRRLGELFACRALTTGLLLEARVKEWRSILDKLDRKALNLPTIKALDDLVGIRGVFLFKRDLATAAAVVK